MLLWVGAQGVPIGWGISQINFKEGAKSQHEVLRDARRDALVEAESLTEEGISDLWKFGLLPCVPTLRRRKYDLEIQIV